MDRTWSTTTLLSRIRGFGGRIGRGRARTVLRSVAAVAIAGAVVVALRVSGSLADIDATLQVMGFDPDRARLLTAFSAEAVAIAIAVLATRGAAAASLAGIVGGAAVFRRTFQHETGDALRSSGAAGSFDLGGWLLTLGTLSVSLVVVAWATASLALIVRQWLERASDDALAVARGHGPRRALLRPGAVALGAAILLLTVPILGDMLNYDPDVRMIANAPPAQGIAQAGPPGSPSGSATLPSGVLDHAGILPPGAVAAAPAAGAIPAILSTRRPWEAWRPSGPGGLVAIPFPAPWTGGTVRTTTVDVYLPPGYHATGRRYPTIYEAPWSLTGGWTTAVRVQPMLDALIDTGQLPPTIMVFVSEHGDAYPDSECVNSVDGREWFERFLTTTVVPYVDSHFRTISRPTARAVVGYSQGGYCASMLAMRHPDLFASALSWSGYFQAGIRSSQTPNAWRPFGGDPTVEAAWSPFTLAQGLAPRIAGRMFVELSADPSDSFYGVQYGSFAATLHAVGVPVALFPTRLGHAWTAVRVQAPTMLMTLADRWTALGVFG
jgi:enterochelin esterase-like enzyme